MSLAMLTEVDDSTRARLFEIATPDLYQMNAFRVLGLPVDATRTDVRKREKRMRRNERLGFSSSVKGGYLPLPETPDEDDVRQAMHRLQDPLARLFDEFFWFWPHQLGRDDEALKLLECGQVEEARELWLSLESSGTKDMISTHNLAVLYHISALDLEQQCERESSPENEGDADLDFWEDSQVLDILDGKPEKEDEARLDCWHAAYKHWHTLVDHDPFWTRVQDRIRDLDDPQLTPEVAHETRDALSEVILLINARLAVKASEANLDNLATQHVQIMRQSQFDPRLISSALRDCLRPIRHRLSNICGDAELKVDADPDSANIIGRNLLDDAYPLLKSVDKMLPEKDAMREGAHDEVARTALRCQIAYGNKTEDWKEASTTLDIILDQLRPSDSMRTRIEENKETLAANLKSGVCHFCEMRRASDDCAVKRRMYGNVRKAPGPFGYDVTWQHVEITVPRCHVCKKHHGRIDFSAVSGGALSSMLVAGLCFLIALAIGIGDGGEVAIILAIPLAPFVGMIGVLIGMKIAESQVAYKIKRRGDVDNFDRIKELRRQKWKYGKSPSEEEQLRAPTDRAAGRRFVGEDGGSGGGISESECPQCGHSSYTMYSTRKCPRCTNSPGDAAERSLPRGDSEGDGTGYGVEKREWLSAPRPVYSVKGGESSGTVHPNCPHCGSKQVVAASNRGSDVRCMSCGAKYEVP